MPELQIPPVFQASPDEGTDDKIRRRKRTICIHPQGSDSPPIAVLE